MATVLQEPRLAVLNSAWAVERIVASSALLLPLSLATQLWPAPDKPRHLPHLDIKVPQQTTITFPLHYQPLAFSPPPPPPHQYALPYHTSAVLASALDTSSLVYRANHSHSSVADTVLAVTEGGRQVSAVTDEQPVVVCPPSKCVHTFGQTSRADGVGTCVSHKWTQLLPLPIQVASLGCALPLPLTRGSSLASLLARPLHTHLTPLTPYLSASDNTRRQQWVVRGIPSDYPIK